MIVGEPTTWRLQVEASKFVYASLEGVGAVNISFRSIIYITLYLKNIDLEQRASLTISELNIQDDGMLILCEVGVYATSQFSLVPALRVGFDETSIQVYGEQIIYQNLVFIYISKLMQALLS